MLWPLSSAVPHGRVTAPFGRVAAVAVVLLAIAGLAAAQTYSPYGSSYSSRNSRNSRSTSHRGGGAGGDFPSWERDVSAGELVPLPSGRPGRYAAGSTVDVGGLPLGVVAVDSGFATALAGGGVVFVRADGSIAARIETAPCTREPVELGSNVLVSMGRKVARIAPDGITWTAELGAELVRAPVLSHPAAPDMACALADGAIVSLRSSTGDTAWTASAGAPARAFAMLSEVLIAALETGEVIGLDRATGQELWRAKVGTSATSLIADSTAAWVGGRGATSRTKDEAPLIARLPLSRDGRRLAGGRDWKLRVGAQCDAAPLLLDDLVAFTCHDGYVRAVDREKGVAGWRTDLPARAWHAPLLAGGRLDFVLDQTRLIVALQPDNGAVLGWGELSDEDEIFVGPAAWASNTTCAATSLGRLVMMTWEWEAKLAEDEDESLNPLAGPDAKRRVP